MKDGIFWMFIWTLVIIAIVTLIKSCENFQIKNQCIRKPDNKICMILIEGLK